MAGSVWHSVCTVQRRVWAWSARRPRASRASWTSWVCLTACAVTPTTTVRGTPLTETQSAVLTVTPTLVRVDCSRLPVASAEPSASPTALPVKVLAYHHTCVLSYQDQARREQLSNSFFREICNPYSCLNYLIPPKRDTSVTSRLRAATPYISNSSRRVSSFFLRVQLSQPYVALKSPTTTLY